MRRLAALITLVLAFGIVTSAMATTIDTPVWHDSNARYITFDIQYENANKQSSWNDWNIVTMRYSAGQVNKCTVQKASIVYDKWFYIEVEGTMSAMSSDYAGSLRYQILDNDGFVVGTGSISLYGLKKGDRFKQRNALYSCDIIGYYNKYTIRFIDND